MARLIPSDFDFSTVVHSEQRSARVFLEHLDDSWYVIPRVPVLDEQTDSEIDIVLLSHDQGMFIVEVKGGLITVADGRWKSYDRIMSRSPSEQALKAKHALLRRLKKDKVDLDGVFAQHIVVFPDNADFPDTGGDPGTPRDIIFTQFELGSPETALRNLYRPNKVASAETIAGVLRSLKPSIGEIEVNGGHVTGATQRISRASVDELKLLFDLDENRRIILRGGAGTGKTFLAHHWAKRALERGDKTLFVCFNRALGQDLYEKLKDFAEEPGVVGSLHVGSFHALANALLGDRRLEVPPGADQQFWDNAHADALIAHRDTIGHRFDTIIIDEGQDFPEKWLGAIEDFLKDKEQSRLYVMLDEEQDLFNGKPGLPKNATLFRLRHNIRSTRHIADLAEGLGGASPSTSAPIGPGVDIHVVSGAKERRKAIAKSLTTINKKLGIPLSQILILVPHNKDIVELTSQKIGEFTIKSWNERDEESVTCATIHGTKGLERLAVIVASLDDEVDDNVIYVGITRASVYLALVGTKQFIEVATNPGIQAVDGESASQLTADPSDDVANVEGIA